MTPQIPETSQLVDDLVQMRLGEMRAQRAANQRMYETLQEAVALACQRSPDAVEQALQQASIELAVKPVELLAHLHVFFEVLPPPPGQASPIEPESPFLVGA